MRRARSEGERSHGKSLANGGFGASLGFSCHPGGTNSSTLTKIIVFLWFRNRFDATQQEYVAHDPEQQDDGRGRESSGERVRSRNDVPGNDGRGNCRDLATKIYSACERPDAFSRRNERCRGPRYWRRCRQSPESKADPDHRGRGTTGTRCAEDCETESHSHHQNSLANTVGIVTMLNQNVHQPPTKQDVGESGKKPGHTGVKNGMQQVHMKRDREIAGQPRQQKKESVVVGSPSKRQSVNLPLPQQVAERTATSCFCL